MGYSTAEIAAELGLSTGAVLTRLFRARKLLRVLCGENTSMDPEDGSSDPDGTSEDPGS
jgi:DNA-directed RNA polymerase specialized sigma24 family protein